MKILAELATCKRARSTARLGTDPHGWRTFGLAPGLRCAVSTREATVTALEQWLYEGRHAMAILPNSQGKRLTLVTGQMTGG